MSWCGEGRWKTFQQNTRLQELWPGWRQLYIERVKCHGDHFDAWSLPSQLRFFSGMGPRSRSFQRLTSHLIAFHYPRHRNLIQFGCCWCLENGWIRFRPMRTKPLGHCPQTLIEVHWRLCQYLCNKLWYESGLLPSVVSCRSLQQVSSQWGPEVGVMVWFEASWLLWR